MDIMEIIKQRRSVRTFDGKGITPEEQQKLYEYVQQIKNPYDIPVHFMLVDARSEGLFSPVIEGEQFYIIAKVPGGPHSEEAFGYSFEQLVLYACSIGLGTTWMAGTLDRKIFEKVADLQEGEMMYCVTPVGHAAAAMSETEQKMRAGIGADERKPAAELFFDKDFATPLAVEEEKLKTALEAVRLGPSAVNYQPWRIVRDGKAFHFYETYNKALHERPEWDVQKIDMGIALCHFIGLTGGTCSLSDPGLACPEDTQYIATVTV